MASFGLVEQHPDRQEVETATARKPALRDKASARCGGRQKARVAFRARRNQYAVLLRDLAKLTGFSIVFLWLVGRGRPVLALTSLHTRAEALGRDVGGFFPSEEVMHEPHPPHVTVASENSKTSIASTSNRPAEALWFLTPRLI